MCQRVYGAGAEERTLDAEVLNQVRAQSLAEKNAQVVLMPGAREVVVLGRPSRDSTVCLHS